MTARWKAVFASRACLLVCALVSSAATADQVKLVVNGVLVCTTNKQDRTVGLYMEKSAGSDSEIAADTTKPDGKFTLAPLITPKRLNALNLWVICKPMSHDDTTCTPHVMDPVNYGSPKNNIISKDLALTCTPVDGSPTKRADALAALAETHEVLVWAGKEKLDAADAALKDAVARADKALNPEERERFKTALAAAAAPLRVGSHRGLPLLPSLKRDDFAEEMIAAAPGWRWLTQPESNDRLPAPYGERDGRFEGNVVHRVGSTFSDSLISLSEGSLSVDPKTQAALELTWPASAGSRVCLEANPIVPGISWNMRAAAAPGSESFTWDLSAARSAGVKKDTLGIVARSCIDADHDQRRYIPVRAGTTAPNEMAYRLVFLFPRQLTAIDLTVFQGDGASQRKIALPTGAIKFDPDTQTPTVTIDVPTSNLDPGLVHLEMSGSGPGRFGPERLSFLHSQRASR